MKPRSESSPRASSRASARAAAWAALRFDPDALRLKSSSQLSDPAFVGALHAALEAELGAAEAAIALLQIGCLHGLRDALRAIEAPLAPGRREAGTAGAPRLAICFRTRPGMPHGALELHGTWPYRGEASARLARIGAGSASGCHLSAGYTSGWLSAGFDAELLAVETSCSGAGAERCGFVARELGSWRASGEAGPCALLDALPFGILRELAQAELDEEPAPAPVGAFDPEAAVVHIWGPVMVIPFGGSDEALRAVELIGRDPGAREVSVVVLDLTGAVIDEAFGAVALEQIVETIEMWGADAIFAGASPLSERVVATLERQPLVVHKDVETAVAAAFRIARSQRRLA